MKKPLIISAISVLVVLMAVASYFLFFNKKPVIIQKVQNDDMIVVSSPIKNAEISSPLRISGRARGGWYFEGSFPVQLIDQYGNTIAEGYVTSQGEWMTEDFVPFLGTLQFNNYIKGQEGTLILKKDNLSGLPEHDDSVEIPVIFK